ncbi:hypothetical protein ACSS6W_000346 [Trichoderma asperelloides]
MPLYPWGHLFVPNVSFPEYNFAFNYSRASLLPLLSTVDSYAVADMLLSRRIDRAE